MLHRGTNAQDGFDALGETACLQFLSHWHTFGRPKSLHLDEEALSIVSIFQFTLFNSRLFNFHGFCTRWCRWLVLTCSSLLSSYGQRSQCISKASSHLLSSFTSRTLNILGLESLSSVLLLISLLWRILVIPILAPSAEVSLSLSSDFLQRWILEHLLLVYCPLR